MQVASGQVRLDPATCVAGLLLLSPKDPAMLTLFGPRLAGRTCDGVSRRDFLRIGALGFGGLTLADLLRLKPQGAVRPEAAHKAVIMVYLPGGPSHIDMYDLKP